MMMTLLIFVRHGQTNDNLAGRLSGRSPIPLNNRGQEQARLASAALAPLGVSHLFSSPIPRARWTAELLAERLQLTIEDAPELREVEYGDWEGKRISELQGSLVGQFVVHDPIHAVFPHGEALLGVQQRGLRAIESICRHYPDDTVVLVTHGDVIRTVLAHYLGWTFNAYRHLTVDNGALSAVAIDETGSQVQAVNVVPSPDHPVLELSFPSSSQAQSNT